MDFYLVLFLTFLGLIFMFTGKVMKWDLAFVASGIIFLYLGSVIAFTGWYSPPVVNETNTTYGIGQTIINSSTVFTVDNKTTTVSYNTTIDDDYKTRAIGLIFILLAIFAMYSVFSDQPGLVKD